MNLPCIAQALQGSQTRYANRAGLFKADVCWFRHDSALFQNAVEDAAAGQELKHHVGEAVTARGVVLVKVDGSMSLLVDAFQVHGERGGFFGGNPRGKE